MKSVIAVHMFIYFFVTFRLNLCDFLFVPRGGSVASRLYKTGPHAVSCTLSHLENQVSSALSLRSGNEYHFWLMTYIRYLVQEGKWREVQVWSYDTSH